MTCLIASNLAAQGTYTDPKNTDSDFSLQGEYAGEITVKDNTVKLGVQVIALGKGKFEAVAYVGGLPGAGWDPAKPAVRTTAMKDEQGEVTFVHKGEGDQAGKGGKGVLKDGKLVLHVGSREIALLKVHRKSPTLGQKPPQGAVVLFDGSSVEHWKDGRLSDDKLLMEGTTSKDTFGSHKIHIEFRLPYKPGRARAGPRQQRDLYSGAVRMPDA